jgi:DNA-binding transcriptional regulator PaaX
VNIPDKMQISAELIRLIERQTKFFEKIDPTPSELQEFEWAGERIRKLFAELAQKKAA